MSVASCHRVLQTLPPFLPPPLPLSLLLSLSSVLYASSFTFSISSVSFALPRLSSRPLHTFTLLRTCISSSLSFNTFCYSFLSLYPRFLYLPFSRRLFPLLFLFLHTTSIPLLPELVPLFPTQPVIYHSLCPTYLAPLPLLLFPCSSSLVHLPCSSSRLPLTRCKSHWTNEPLIVQTLRNK